VDERERLENAVDAIRRVQEAAKKAAQKGEEPPEEKLPEEEDQTGT